MTVLKFTQHPQNLIELLGVLSFFTILFGGCTPDLAQVEALSMPTTPDQILSDATIYYSKNGIVEVRLRGKYMEAYEGDNARRIFKDGVFCEFFHADKTLKATLSSKEVKEDIEKKLVEISNNVVIIDYRKGDTIYCEQVFWDQKKHLIYSDKLIKRVQPTGMSFGDGFVSNEQFDSLRIKNLRGVHTYTDTP